MKLTISILSKELEGYTQVYKKSFYSFRKGEISNDLHKEHISNLRPKIYELCNSIYYLNTITDSVSYCIDTSELRHTYNMTKEMIDEIINFNETEE